MQIWPGNSNILTIESREIHRAVIVMKKINSVKTVICHAQIESFLARRELGQGSELALSTIQGHLAHKKTPTPLGPP